MRWRLDPALRLMRSAGCFAGAFAACFLGMAGAAMEARAVDILTHHYDAQRSGWNSQETVLTPGSVQDPSFGMLYTVPLDDHVDAQPLVVSNQPISGVTGNRTVVYVATNANSIYAIDADSGQVLLTTNLGAPVPMSTVGGCGNNSPNLGIGATPVIDRSAGLLYVIAFTFDGQNPSYTLHALDLSTLADALPPVVVTATAALDDGTTYTFDPSASRLRAALLEANGNIYAGFGSFCDLFADRSRGWVLGWNASTLQPLAFDRLNNDHATSPTTFFLTSVWMSGSGIAAGPDGSLFFVTGNADPTPDYDSNANANLSESLLKVTPDLSRVADFFTPFEVDDLDANDTDFGSGGVVLLPPQPGTATNYAVVAGKSGKMYLIDQQKLGRVTPGGPDNVVGTFDIGGGCWCAQSYFTGADGVGRIVSSGGASAIIWQFKTSPTVALAQQTVTDPLNSGQDPGFFTSVSSNGTQDGTALIWAVSRPVDDVGQVQLYAFDGSSGVIDFQASAGTWLVPQGNANIVPVVANGQVFVATTRQLAVFGLGATPTPPPTPAPVSADGSVLTPGSGGSLVTTDGTWTFSPIIDPGGNEIDLNSAQAGDGAGVKLVVAQGGHLFALNNASQWWEWQTGSWAQASDPTAAASLPTPAPAAAVAAKPTAAVTLAAAPRTAGTSTAWRSTAAKPARDSEHHVSGTITWTDGIAALTVKTRWGRLISIDAIDAHDAHQSVLLTVGETVTASGIADGHMLRARTILRAKDSPALWPPDR